MSKTKSPTKRPAFAHALALSCQVLAKDGSEANIYLCAFDTHLAVTVNASKAFDAKNEPALSLLAAGLLDAIGAERGETLEIGRSESNIPSVSPQEAIMILRELLRVKGAQPS